MFAGVIMVTETAKAVFYFIFSTYVNYRET